MTSKKKRRTREVVGKTTLTDSTKLSDFTIDEVIEELKSIAIRELRKKKMLNELMDAWKPVEEKNKRVADVVMDAVSYCAVRKYIKDIGGDYNTEADLIKKGQMGTLWGARVWVVKEARGVSTYQENSRSLPRHFPAITKAKKELGYND